MVYQTYVVPGSYPGSLPRDHLSQQQREMIRDAIKPFLWQFQLEIVTHGPLPVLLIPHLKVTTSQPPFLFPTHLPTPPFHPRQMAASHLVFLQGNEKSYKDLNPLPPPPEGAQTRGRIGVVQRLNF